MLFVELDKTRPTVESLIKRSGIRTRIISWWISIGIFGFALTVLWWTFPKWWSCQHRAHPFQSPLRHITSHDNFHDIKSGFGLAYFFWYSFHYPWLHHYYNYSHRVLRLLTIWNTNKTSWDWAGPSSDVGISCSCVRPTKNIYQSYFPVQILYFRGENH